ncbi:MAG TPA: winged helix-turn-helix domain-containing protein [Acetobacteraceae bacterium]|nr:winged helix-turn-helix domain-containing protein [Acetobacteraceae bacterium]
MEFGRFRLDAHRRELLADGLAVPIGSRAFDILIALVEAGGRLVTKDELLRSVWSGTVVEEHNLQFQISTLRKALGPDRDFIKTISGRGYRFVADIIDPAAPEEAPSSVSAALLARRPDRFPLTNLPAPMSELVGLDAAVQQVQELLTERRAVTLTGPGGIGKTTLALEAARRMFPAFNGDVWLVELASLSDPDLVPSTVARAIGLKLASGEISSEAAARAIGERKLLLVLDNCEHVIDAAASLAEAVVRLCPAASVLATSRETLRIAGEYIFQVPALHVPPPHQDGPDLVLRHSAAQLFVARAQALRSDFSPNDEGLSAIAAICRHLDGIPLAIEFAAARAAALGVQQVASGLEDRFRLLTAGRRPALPRHQTLRATLDWSYDLLSDAERRLLRRLAIFPSGFTLDAATAILHDIADAVSSVVVGIANLVAKSLVVLDGSAAAARDGSCVCAGETCPKRRSTTDRAAPRGVLSGCVRAGRVRLAVTSLHRRPRPLRPRTRQCSRCARLVVFARW